MLRRVVVTVLLWLVGLLAGAGIAAADCATPAAPHAGTAAAPVDASGLPHGFPADLRQFVAGTEEFRKGSWFTGACAGKGGDLGAYINAELAQENRLIYWRLPDDKKLSFLSFHQFGELAPGEQTKIAQAIKDGVEPGSDVLPKVFPAGDPAYAMPTGMCANDLKAWGSPADNPWGFTWSAAPDSDSLSGMQAAAAAHGTVPGEAWSRPCSAGAPYCMHAFFLDCTHADGHLSAETCAKWNQAVGAMFGGTANWLEKNKSFSDRFSGLVQALPAFQAGKFALEGMSAVAKTEVKAAKAMVDFVANPGGSLAASWANDMKKGAVDVSTSTLQSITCSHRFDPLAPDFLKEYQAAVTLGFVVMAFLLVHTVVRSGTHGSPRELAQSLFLYAPAGIFVSMFAPLFASFVLGVTEPLSEGAAKLTGQSVGQLVSDVTGFGSATSDNFLGGAIGGLVLFFVLLLASLILWVGMMFHQYGLPLSAFVAGISLLMLVSPRWRRKALTPVAVFLGIALSVPLLILLLGVVYRVADAGWVDPAAGTASKVLFVAVGFVIAAAAPWSLLKWAPILPDRNSFDTGGGGGVGAVTLGAAGNYLMYGRGGRSGGDIGVGSAQPTVRADTATAALSPPAAGAAAPGGLAAATPQMGPLQAAYLQRQRGDLATIGGRSGGEPVGARPLVHGSGESAARSGQAGAQAGAGAASGGVAVAAGVAASAASAAITKAKAAADGAAPDLDI
ncbi:hypothetical protein FOS14_23470 [Skermania sp. ID1734]|uniref:hypothetical protein n=1 Tax=Skermania sp. ID1734 TaxID=2597516 RepID=UPI00117CB11A|nr:hypothetical protein [Skermania sp. ID1734]TSD93261.1 hypothetical protein FOS14_23470 [Skermania sp. ID1734]